MEDYTNQKWRAVQTVGDNYNIEVDTEDGVVILANVTGEANAELIASATRLKKSIVELSKASERFVEEVLVPTYKALTPEK